LSQFDGVVGSRLLCLVLGDAPLFVLVVWVLSAPFRIE
jgi:hypothetical protein